MDICFTEELSTSETITIVGGKLSGGCLDFPGKIYVEIYPSPIRDPGRTNRLLTRYSKHEDAGWGFN